MIFSTGRSARVVVGKQLQCIAFSAAVAAVLASGCTRRSTSPNLPPPLPDTPDGKLEGVMRRFRANLEFAHSAEGSGVKSVRTASLHKIGSGAQGAGEKAEVTVTTTVAVDRAPGDEAITPEDLVKQDALDDKNGAAEKQAPKAIEPVITQEKLVLGYDGSRWAIAEQPKDTIIRDCIGNALEGQ